MRFKVRLPGYPCHHIVTGLTTARGAGGKALRVAEASAVRKGMAPFASRDLVTLMLLHDAIVSRGMGAGEANDIGLYGRSKSYQASARARIDGAKVSAE